MSHTSSTRARNTDRWILPLVALLLAIAALAATPTRAASQGWLDRVKKSVSDGVAAKVEEHKTRAESTVVATAANATDSALTKSNRGLGTTADKASSLANKGINSAETGVASLFAGATTTPDQLAADLKAGRVIVRDIEWGGDDGSTLKPTSDAFLQKLAAALTNATGNYLVESHVNLVGDSDIEQALSDRRAPAVMARLASLGVPAERLSAKGFGATRPLEGNARGATTNARIEVTLVQ